MSESVEPNPRTMPSERLRVERWTDDEGIEHIEIRASGGNVEVLSDCLDQLAALIEAEPDPEDENE